MVSGVVADVYHPRFCKAHDSGGPRWLRVAQRRTHSCSDGRNLDGLRLVFLKGFYANLHTHVPGTVRVF